MIEYGEADGVNCLWGYIIPTGVVATLVELASFPFSVVAIASYRPRLPHRAA